MGVAVAVGTLVATGRTEHAAVDGNLRPRRLPGMLVGLLDQDRSYPLPEGPC